MKTVFYIIDDLSLVSGNKTAGFNVSVPTDVVKCLYAYSISGEDAQFCNQLIREQLARTKLLPEVLMKKSGVAFYKNTLLPQVFVQDSIGGSLGLSHDEVEDIFNEQIAPEFKPAVLGYTPHNVDSAEQALALMVIVQTWAEWARSKVLIEA